MKFLWHGLLSGQKFKGHGYTVFFKKLLCSLHGSMSIRWICFIFGTNTTHSMAHNISWCFQRRAVSSSCPWAHWVAVKNVAQLRYLDMAFTGETYSMIPYNTKWCITQPTHHLQYRQTSLSWKVIWIKDLGVFMWWFMAHNPSEARQHSPEGNFLRSACNTSVVYFTATFLKSQWVRWIQSSAALMSKLWR